MTLTNAVDEVVFITIVDCRRVDLVAKVSTCNLPTLYDAIITAFSSNEAVHDVVGYR